MLQGILNFGAPQQALQTLRIFVLLVMLLVYAAYDTFNRRNIPNEFAYLSVVIGLMFALTLDYQTLEYGLLTATAVAAIAYLLYKSGQLGAGDGFEFVAISLLMPAQPQPILVSMPQLQLPFILSVFIATGFITIIAVPIYYLASIKNKRQTLSLRKVGEGAYQKASILLLAYATLFLFVTFSFGLRLVPLLIIVLIAVPAAITALYERTINMKMVSVVYPNELEEGDIIAINLMNGKDIEYFRERSSLFGKLVTRKLINQIKHVRRKIHVYKNAVPLALLTLVGFIISLLFGNILLFIVLR